LYRAIVHNNFRRRKVSYRAIVHNNFRQRKVSYQAIWRDLGADEALDEDPGSRVVELLLPVSQADLVFLLVMHHILPHFVEELRRLGTEAANDQSSQINMRSQEDLQRTTVFVPQSGVTI
jgi:hypothetical protein